MRTGTGKNPGSVLGLDGPGTDCDVKIKIYGTSRTTGRPDATDSIELKKSKDHGNKFESGK